MQNPNRPAMSDLGGSDMTPEAAPEDNDDENYRHGEKGVDALVDAGVGSYLQIRERESRGGKLGVGDSVQLSLLGEDTDEAEAAEHRHRNPLPAARRQSRRGLTIGKRQQARGETTAAEDGAWSNLA